MIANSSAYMEVLFEAIKSFAKSPGIVSQASLSPPLVSPRLPSHPPELCLAARQAWGLLMRVPTNVQRLAALNRPELVDWRGELSKLETEPMRVLYVMQARLRSRRIILSTQTTLTHVSNHTAHLITRTIK